MIQPASRVNEVQEYYFSRKLKEVAKMNADGQDIISLAIGSPDMPPSEQTRLSANGRDDGAAFGHGRLL